LKRRQRILQAVGESALPEVLVQLRKRDVADAEDITGSEGNTISSVNWRGWITGIPTAEVKLVPLFEADGWECITGLGVQL
jgi:hypothetical protein